MQLSGKIICIYGASSSKIDEVYPLDAHRLGVLIGEAGAGIICGGGRGGLMAAVTDGVLSTGGKAIGVLPQFMVDKQWQHPGLTEMISTSGMHPRKQIMAERSDAAVALPGGIGTFDELFEIITWRQLGLYRKPVVLLNTAGYFDPLLEMLNTAARKQFVSNLSQLFTVAATPEDVIAQLQEWSADKESSRNYNKTYETR